MLVAATKLSEAQRRVLSWIGKGWRTEPGPGNSIMVNGKRTCGTDTMMSLYRLGFAQKVDLNCWAATPGGVAETKRLGL